MCKLVGLTAIPSKYKSPMQRRKPGKTKEPDKICKKSRSEIQPLNHDLRQKRQSGVIPISEGEIIIRGRENNVTNGNNNHISTDNIRGHIRALEISQMNTDSSTYVYYIPFFFTHR
jgi:hypothetical protein